jgi:hypothetical protein
MCFPQEIVYKQNLPGTEAESPIQHKITAFNPRDPFVNYYKMIYPLQDIYGLEMNDGGRAFQVLKKRGGIKGALFYWIC